MSILKILKEEHERVLFMGGRIFRFVKESRGAFLPKNEFSFFSSLLAAHTQAEEKILYLPLKEMTGADHEILEGLEEHKISTQVLSELDTLAMEDPAWSAKLDVLLELLAHHMEEEQGKLFVSAKKSFTDEQLEELGSRFQRERDFVLLGNMNREA